ncbi:MAG: hypothetical protein RJA56_12 [Pseudomonadota bacterium]
MVELAEHGHEALSIQAGLLQDRKANAVGLALHVARKAQLRLHRGGLTADDDRIGHVHIGAGAGGQDTQNHGAQKPRRLLVLARNEPCDVALRHVAELVRHHAGDFRGTVGGGDQPQIHTHVTTGQGEGVDAFVSRDDQLPRKALGQLGTDVAAFLCGFEQGLPQQLQVVAEHRVVDVIGVAVNALRDAIAQAPLLGNGHALLVAQAGQGGLGHAQGCRQGTQNHPAKTPRAGRGVRTQTLHCHMMP